MQSDGYHRRPYAAPPCGPLWGDASRPTIVMQPKGQNGIDRMSKKRVLITGMSGLIGQVCQRELGGSYALSALNRRSVAGVPCVQADIADLEAIRPAFEGVDVVVHLAAIAEGDATWEEVLPHNIVGTYNVFEAARIAGVKRIISASSGAAVSDSEREMPYRALVEGRYDEVTRWEKLDASVVRPSGLYGCSKLWGEALARHFSDAWGLSMICLRIGMVNQADRPTSTREFSIWCSQRDIGQMVQRCIDAPQSLKFATFYAVSDNKWSYRSLDGARRELGFEPRDQAEQHR